jgi:hypothetical protein
MSQRSSKFERALVLHLSAQLLKDEDYARAVERAFSLIRAYEVEMFKRRSQEQVETDPCCDWATGLKRITGESRLARAERKFAKLGRPDSQLEQWRKTGFCVVEMTELSALFAQQFSEHRKEFEKKFLRTY